jgi:glucose-fructose oxidoreductase
MGDLLREVFEHPDAEIVGISDEQPERMQTAVKDFGLVPEQVFSDYKACLEATKPDAVILCPAASEHGEWTEKVAPFDVHILVEKPFAASLEEADRMIAAMAKTGKQLAINWPLRWYPAHVTAKRLVDEGRIGSVQEVHYYDGNRGPLYHTADKIEVEPRTEDKANSWFYKKDRGGGSLLDYLGYGTTLATWYHNGAAPTEVMCMCDEPAGLEVDEHSITLARYASGLSKFETRWGTFSDPWVMQPQPKCGFVIKGTTGTVSSFDFEPTVRLQTPECPEGEAIPVDALPPHASNAMGYFIDCLKNDRPIDGPLSPAISRIGQQIVDTAYRSAKEKRAMALIG